MGIQWNLSRREAEETPGVMKEDDLSSRTMWSLESHHHQSRLEQEVETQTGGVLVGDWERQEKKKMADYSDRVDCVENCIESCCIVVGGGGKI